MMRFTIFGIIILSIFVVSYAHAESSVKSTNFENTTLIEFTNDGNAEIKTIKLWLGKDSGVFKSFKVEKGWVGTKTPQGVLVFSSESPLSPGQSLKIGVKTEMAGPGINWRTLDPSDRDITIGKSIPDVTSNPADQSVPQDNGKKTSIDIQNAVFRVIPDSPKNGDTVRIVGDGFPKSTTFDFRIDGEKLEDFQTDGKGHLIGKAKIPLNKEADRVEFSLVDRDGNSKTISIRINHSETQKAPTEVKRLTVDKFDAIIEPGQKTSASGTGIAGSSITITANDPTGSKIYESVVPVDSQGNWIHETTIPPDAEIGSRNVDFSDGINTITKTISVSISKIIHLVPSAITYNPGDKMLFNGTAKPKQTLEVIINDPIGKEVFSDILQVDDSGNVGFTYQTTPVSPKGTYVLFASQGSETEITRIGLGEPPSEGISAKFDKLSYSTSDDAKLTINGPAKATISLLIIDPSDKIKVTDSITTGLDGSSEYEIDLANYKSGIYSAVLKYTKSEAEVVFAVDLQSGSGTITMQATKQTYKLGDGILLLGSTEKSNVLLNLKMTDPDGKITKIKEVFTDKEGKFSDDTFRVPSDAKQGIWNIKATSGPNWADAEFKVSSVATDAFSINVDKTTPYRAGETVTISGSGGGRAQTVIITILDPKNVEVDELVIGSKEEDGSFQTLWVVPPEKEIGTYKINVKVGAQSASTTFTLQ